MHPLGNINAQKNRVNGVLRRAGYSTGGAVSMGGRTCKPPGKISPDFGGKATPAYKAGGAVSGAPAKSRLDKFARGGRTKKAAQTKINIIVAPQGGGAQRPPMPMPVPMPMPQGGPPPMGGGPMAGPPMSNGGAYAKGGKVRAIGGGPIPVPMTAGGGGAKGRLQKAKDYGKRGR